MLGGDPFRQKCFLGCYGVPRVTFLSSWRPRAGSRIVLVSATDLSGLCWRLALGAPTDAPGGSWPGVPGVSGGVPGRPRGLLGEGLGGTEITDRFLRVSGGGPGGSLGSFWSSGVVLGTDLGNGNVDISLVLNVFLRRVCFSFFCCICISDFSFDDRTKVMIF